MALRLLKHGREDVADICFVPLCALDVQDGRLQSAPKRRRLLRLLFDSSAEALDRFVEVCPERAPERRQVGAAGLKDSLAVGIVRESIEQVLERDVHVPPRDGFAERDVEDDGKRW